jgi:alpha-mannosidase
MLEHLARLPRPSKQLTRSCRHFDGLPMMSRTARLTRLFSGVGVSRGRSLALLTRRVSRNCGPVKQNSIMSRSGPRDIGKSHRGSRSALTTSHIDVAWLWRYTQTQQKIARSFSSQIDLINRFPTYHFSASSAQQYHWLEKLYPTLFESVKKMIAGGRFHPVGGSWLEHDCILPSGESLCRQYLYGQRYFEKHFGQRCKEAWLPDTFGYASQLPQILRLAGIENFFTQKVCLRKDMVLTIFSFRGTTSTSFHTLPSIGSASTVAKFCRT